MSERRKWDMTSTHSLEAGAEWFRNNADAAAVLVVRGADMAFVVAAGVKPQEAAEAIAYVLPGAVEALQRRQQMEREAATRRRAQEIVGGAK